MKVGDLVQPAIAWTKPNGEEYGVIFRDHSPMRPMGVERFVDVLWSDGEIEEFWTGDLVVLNEGR